MEREGAASHRAILLSKLCIAYATKLGYLFTGCRLLLISREKSNNAYNNDPLLLCLGTSLYKERLSQCHKKSNKLLGNKAFNGRILVFVSRRVLCTKRI